MRYYYISSGGKTQEKIHNLCLCYIRMLGNETLRRFCCNKHTNVAEAANQTFLVTCRQSQHFVNLQINR